MDQELIIDTTPIVGPLFIGALLAWMLMGTLIVQVYWYSKRFPRDRLPLRLFVLFIFLIDFLQTIVAAWSVWALVIENWGDVQTLEQPPRVAVAAPIFSAGVAALVQSFYAWRIWTIGMNKPLKLISVVIVAIAIMHSTSCFVSAAKFAIWDVAARLIDLRTGFTVWLVGSFVADILITGSMLYILNKAKSTAFSESTTLLDKLIRQTVETSAVTVVCAGVELVLFLLYPLNDEHVAPAYVLGKLYSNCLLATLNSRTPSTPSSTECSSRNSRSGANVNVNAFEGQSNLASPTFALRPLSGYDSRKISSRAAARNRRASVYARDLEAAEVYVLDEMQADVESRRERWGDSTEAMRVEVERETVIVVDAKDEVRKDSKRSSSSASSEDVGSM